VLGTVPEYVINHADADVLIVKWYENIRCPRNKIFFFSINNETSIYLKSEENG
jgi:hypothetical protein